MSNLLDVIRVKPKPKTSETAMVTPLMVEVPVNPELAPYLVSSRSGVLWVEKARPGDNIVRAAVRVEGNPGQMFCEVMFANSLRGIQERWGNVHDFSEQGVKAAVQHLELYEISDIEVLVSSGDLPPWVTALSKDIVVRKTGWVPSGYAVVVPVDKAFLGTLLHIGPGGLAFVVHNPSRALAVCFSG